MASADRAFKSGKRPGSLGEFVLPRRQSYYQSPVDWREEILYFLLVDRFSDGKEKRDGQGGGRPLLDRKNLAAARKIDGMPLSWDQWAKSGAERWQGGTLRGVESKLEYLKKLGITAIWLSPVFKQRGEDDTCHGYGIQDFLDIDPHFGTRRDLLELVASAHKKGLRVILDIIFNHSGCNWLYPEDTPGGAFEPIYTTGQYKFGHWRGNEAESFEGIKGRDYAVWPAELKNEDRYTRAGKGDLGAGSIDDATAEHKRSDFCRLRDFNLAAPGLLDDLARCYKYWIALTDCDGFRIDTLKHVTFDQARNFCGTIKEFAANLGKDNFFLVGEIAGGDYNADRYIDAIDRNMNATLDIGEMRLALNAVAKGLAHPGEYFKGFNKDAVFGSHRNLGNQHVSILDDHDHVFGRKVRFSADASSDHQVTVGVAIQLFTLGIPCIYYGTEQAFAGPEESERKWLPGWGDSDRYLREAMFGPLHPRKSGREGMTEKDLDTDLPGFGPFGTAGHHCFDENNPVYRRIAAMAHLRKDYPVLSNGRQYVRPMPFNVYSPGEIIAWSRILDDEEALCIVNSHGNEKRSANILVDASLNPPGSEMTVILNTAQAVLADQEEFTGNHPIGAKLSVRKIPSIPESGVYIEIKDLPPSEVLVLTNHSARDEGSL
jgi:glycosidase